MQEKLKLHSFTEKEKDRRWTAVRQLMERRDLDCLIVEGNSGKWDSRMANVRYLTQIGGNGEDGYVVFPLKGEPICLVWTLPWTWRRTPSWVKEENIMRGAPYYSEVIIQCINELGLARGKLGLVGLGGMYDAEGSFPHGVYLKLKEGLPQAEFQNATDILEEVRFIKSEEEIRCIERAAEIGDIAIDAMVKNARVGIKDYELYAKVISAMLSAGSEFPPMLIWDSGPSPIHPGKLATSRELRTGDIIINEISPKIAGYFAHPHQPVAIGKPSEENAKMFTVVKKSFDNGMRLLRPGITLGALDEALAEPIRQSGYIWHHPLFHGLGLAIPEYPEGSIYVSQDHLTPIRPSSETKVKAGMVLAIEPVVTTKNFERSMPLADTVAVTETGARRLSKRPLELYVA